MLAGFASFILHFPIAYWARIVATCAHANVRYRSTKIAKPQMSRSWDGYTCGNGHSRGTVRVPEASLVDFLVAILRALLMFGFVALVIGLLAALFMIVFSLATGIDRKMQQ
jgi:hypothetical protein